MKKDQPYTDEHGVTWITAAKVAEIWNETARKKYGVEASYTRWSVYQRRNDLPYIDTPLGRLFREDEAANVDLRPRTTKREDTTTRNRQRKTKRVQPGEDDEEGREISVTPHKAQLSQPACWVA